MMDPRGHFPSRERYRVVSDIDGSILTSTTSIHEAQNWILEQGSFEDLAILDSVGKQYWFYNGDKWVVEEYGGEYS